MEGRHHGRYASTGKLTTKSGRVQLWGGAPKAADRLGAGGHAAAAGTSRPGFMDVSSRVAKLLTCRQLECTSSIDGDSAFGVALFSSGTWRGWWSIVAPSTPLIIATTQNPLPRMQSGSNRRRRETASWVRRSRGGKQEGDAIGGRGG